MSSAIPTGVYRHYKGPLYVVLGIGRESTNGPGCGERKVIYYSVEKRTLCIRALTQFIEEVPWPDGRTRPRFTPVEETL